MKDRLQLAESLPGTPAASPVSLGPRAPVPGSVKPPVPPRKPPTIPPPRVASTSEAGAGKSEPPADESWDKPDKNERITDKIEKIDRGSDPHFDKTS